MIIDDWWIINSFSFQINVCVCVCVWVIANDWLIFEKNIFLFFFGKLRTCLFCFASFFGLADCSKLSIQFRLSIDRSMEGKIGENKQTAKKNIQPDQLIMIKWLSLRLMIFQKMLGQIYDDKWNFLFFHLLCPSDSYPY